MSTIDRTVPYELLFRFDETSGLRGAHYQDRRIVDIDGKRVVDQPGTAVPVAILAADPGLPLAELLGATLTAALARVDEEVANATAAAERAEAAEAALVTAQAEIVRLTEALAAASSAQVTSTDQNGVPVSVTAFQAQAALLAAGLLDDVEAAVASSDRLVQIAWRSATVFERGSPTLAALAAVVGLSNEQLDDLFRTAARITV